MDALEVDYRLPVTMVTIFGTKTVVNNPILAPHKTTNRVAQIALEIIADPTSAQKLQVEPSVWAKRSLSVSLNTDGRLRAVNSAFEDRSGNRLSNALSIGTSMFASLAPLASTFLGPSGVALAAVAGLARGVAAHSGVLSFMGTGENQDKAESPTVRGKRPTPTELGVNWHYEKEHPEQAALLADLRFSWAILVKQRGQCSFLTPSKDISTLSRELRHIDKALAYLHTGLEQAEAQYSSWVQEQSSTISAEQFHRTFTLDQLPSDEELRQVVAKNPWPIGSKHEPTWYRVLKNLHVAVSVDLLDTVPGQHSTGEATQPSASDPHRTLTYRNTNLARISQWKIETGDKGEYRLSRQLVETKVVVLPGNEQYLPLLHQDGKRTMSALFNAEGLLDEVSYEHTDSRTIRAEQLQNLPSVVSSAVESAGKIAAGLQGLLPAAQDPLEQLRAELNETELRARLARAKVLVSEPTRSLTLFYDHTKTEDSN